MTTTATVLSSDLADLAVQQWFDGRRFDIQVPRDSYGPYRRHSEAAIRWLAENYKAADATSLSDVVLGELLESRISAEFATAGDERTNAGETTAGMLAAYGAWMRGLIDDAVSQGNAKFPLPKWEDFIPDFDLTGPKMQKWALNDTYDIMPSVDEQIAYLREGGVMDRFLETTGTVKNYVSGLMRHKAERLLPVGTKIRVKDAGQGRESLTGIYLERSAGMLAEITGPPELGRREATAFGIVLDGGQAGWVLAHHIVPLGSVVEAEAVSPGNDEPTEPVDTPEVAELKARVERLTRQVAVMRAEGNTITSAILEQAEKRGWCDEYEEFVNEVNSELTYFEFEERTTEFEVTFSYTVTDTGTRSYTVTARNRDDAIEEARGLFDDEDSQDLWDNADSGVDVQVDDVEVE